MVHENVIVQMKGNHSIEDSRVLIITLKTAAIIQLYRLVKYDICGQKQHTIGSSWTINTASTTEIGILDKKNPVKLTVLVTKLAHG
jgi:hypothetical protein